MQLSASARDMMFSTSRSACPSARKGNVRTCGAASGSSSTIREQRSNCSDRTTTTPLQSQITVALRLSQQLGPSCPRARPRLASHRLRSNAERRTAIFAIARCSPVLSRHVPRSTAVRARLQPSRRASAMQAAVGCHVHGRPWCLLASPPQPRPGSTCTRARSAPQPAKTRPSACSATVRAGPLQFRQEYAPSRNGSDTRALSILIRMRQHMATLANTVNTESELPITVPTAQSKGAAHR